MTSFHSARTWAVLSGPFQYDNMGKFQLAAAPWRRLSLYTTMGGATSPWYVAPASNPGASNTQLLTYMFIAAAVYYSV